MTASSRGEPKPCMILVCFNYWDRDRCGWVSDDLIIADPRVTGLNFFSVGEIRGIVTQALVQDNKVEFYTNEKDEVVVSKIVITNLIPLNE